MTSTNYKTADQKSGGLYAMVGFLVLLLVFVAVTFFLPNVALPRSYHDPAIGVSPVNRTL